jgi:hypothetical protein
VNQRWPPPFSNSSALEPAKAALLANKRVWVAANGDPFGFNLVVVLVLS